MLSPWEATSLVGAETLALTTTPTALPSIPTFGVTRLTIRSTDQAWEWQFVSTTGTSYFWMDKGDIFVIPIRDYTQLLDFQFKAVTATADVRILYEA